MKRPDTSTKQSPNPAPKDPVIQTAALTKKRVEEIFRRCKDFRIDCCEVLDLIAAYRELVTMTDDLVVSIDKWESAVGSIIGRTPRTYIELDKARAHLKAHQREKAT